MNAKGFTLIEIMIAMVIASILGGLLVGSFFQSNKTISVINKVVSIDSTATTLIHQLSKDISGAFVPLSVQLLQKQLEKEKKEKPAAVPGKKGEDKKTKPKPKEKKQKLPKIEKIFFSNLKNNNLDTLTFITNNPLQPYWSPRAQGGVAKRPKAKIVRVVYRLIPETNEKPVSYKLLRQESEKLDFSQFKVGGNIRAFEIANNIKEVKTEFYVLISEKKPDSMKPEEGAKKPKLLLKKMPTWNDGKLPGDQKTKISMTPHFVKITIVFWDKEKKVEFPFEAMIPIVPELPLRDIKEPAIKKEPKKKITVKTGPKQLSAREKIDALLNKKK